MHFLPKVKLEAAREESMTEEAVEAIRGSARPNGKGAIGDGKIFIHELIDTIRIRTGETGREAL